MDSPTLDLRAVRVRAVRPHEEPRWNAPHARHYLGFAKLCGPQLKQVAVCGERWLALLAWQAAALPGAGFAGARAEPAAAGRGLAGAPRAPVVAGRDVRGPGPFPGHLLPGRDLPGATTATCTSASSTPAS